MNRCVSRSLSLAIAGTLVALASTAAVAQSSQFVGPTNTPLNPASQTPQTVINVPIPSTTTTTTVTDGLSLQRKFPQKALRGKILFGTPPAVELDGNVMQLAPAYRVHGFNNLLVLSAQLVGTKAIVNYTTDLNGQPYEIWLLTDTEAAVKPWPWTTAEAAAWTFDPVAQTWTKP